MTMLAREDRIGSAKTAEPATARARRKSGVRRDLQGIRGLGIIFVVIGHLWRWPQGVYSMLDMFFVLSGFLITSVLIDSVQRYGGISFAQFYLSRVRRLMPMAVMVVLVTTAAFYLFYSSALGASVANDGKWALVFGINWHFALDSTNYFSDQATSPLLHYWSLSVEEQFYLVWPAVLLIAMLVAPRVHLKARTALYAVLAIVTLASFSFSMWDSVANPTVAYYSTFDRVWEFGIGALLATARLWWVRMPSRLALGLSWVGGLGLIVAIFTLTYGHAFPAPWGLPVVLLTGLVMIGGHGRSTEKLWILDNPVMVYVGDISYSLYLWHLPVNVFLLGYIAHSSPWYYVTAIGVSLALAVVSYHFVERPLRYAPVLMTRRERDFFANRPRRPGIGRGFAILTTTCVAALAVVVSLSGVLSGPGDTSDQPALASTQQLSTPTTAAGPTQTPLTAQQHRVAAALGASHYPHFTPPLSALGSDRWLRDITSSACILDAGRETGTCGFAGSGGAKSALLVGDSFAAAWSPGVRAALQPRGWSVGVMSSPWCPTFTLPSYVDNGGQPNPTCGVLHSQLLRTVRERHPGMVILASSSAEVKNAERKELHTTPTALAHDGLSQTIRDLKAAGAGKVVVLGPPPQLGDLTHCVTRFGSPHDCVARPDQNFRDDVAAERRAAGERGAQYVATQDWFCFQDLCPAFVGRTPVTVDGYHLTMQDSRALAPLLRPALLGG